MKTWLRSPFPRVISYLLVLFLTAGIGTMPFTQTGCGGSGSSNNNNNNNIPQDFNELMKALNTQASVSNQSAYDFAVAFQAYFGANLNNLSASEIQAIISTFNSQGNNFISVIQYYGALVDAYLVQLNSSNLTLGKYQSVGGGIDTMASDVGGVIGDTVQGEADCAAQAMLDTDNEDLQLYKDCIAALRSQQLGQVANIGVGGVLGGGAGAVAGLAAGAVGAGLIVPIAVGTGVGVVAGVVWNWCTSGSSNLKLGKLGTLSGDVCVFVACEDQVRQLPTGQMGIACSVPPGSGTVTIYTEDGVPIVRSVTVTADGRVIDTTDCTGNADTSTIAEANSCIDGTTDSSAAGITGDCSDILAINANINPPDPGPGEAVTVTYTVFPPAAGCPTSFTVSGTDGYSDAGSPTTNSSGSAQIGIPGGAAGVIDTVNISESTNNNSKTLVYTF